MVSPAQFVPLAEETGFIAELGDWVLHQAVAQAARWHRDGRELPVSVNVSALQFRQPDFVERVVEIALDPAAGIRKDAVARIRARSTISM